MSRDRRGDLVDVRGSRGDDLADLGGRCGPPRVNLGRDEFGVGADLFPGLVGPCV